MFLFQHELSLFVTIFKLQHTSGILIISAICIQLQRSHCLITPPTGGEDPEGASSGAGGTWTSMSPAVRNMAPNKSSLLASPVMTLAGLSGEFEADWGPNPEVLPEHGEPLHRLSIGTAAALDLLQLNLLPSIIAPVSHYGICAEKK